MLKWAALCSALFLASSAKSLELEHALQQIREKHIFYSARDFKPVSERHVPDFPPNSYLKSETVENAEKHGVCQPGFTGSDCSNPICYNRSNILEHDGTADFGDLIESDFSAKCNDIFTFYVDNFMNDFYVIITSINGGNPRGVVLNSGGNEVPSCGDFANTESEMIHMYCESRANHGAGLYSLKLSVDNDVGCTFQVRSPTKLGINGGFVQDKRDDYVQQFILGKANQGVFRYPDENANSFFAFEMENEKYPVHPETIHIYQNGVWDQQFKVTGRYGCTASHVTVTPYNCSALHVYHLKVQGYDDEANAWQRIYDFECNAIAMPTDMTLTTDSSSTSIPTSCLNDGIIYGEGCYCSEFFSGPRCEQPLCMNGGSYDANTHSCVCVDDYSGDHCQHVTCKAQSADSFDDSSIAIGFVIRSSSSMKAQIVEITQAVNQMGSYFSTYYPVLVQAWVLTVVQNNGVLFTRAFDSYTELANSIVSLTTPPTETQCDDAILLGIAQTLGQTAFKKFPNSPVFVFTDGVANDDAITRGYLNEQLISTRAQLFFILTNSASEMCIVDVSSNQYQDFRSLASLSRGLLVQVKLTEIQEATFAISQDLWLLDTIMSNDLEDCRKAPKYQPFFVDSSVDFLLLRATGDNLAPLLTLPNQTQIKPDIFYTNGNLNIWKTGKPAVGAYLLNMNSLNSHSSICQYRLMGRTNYRLYSSFSTSITVDNSQQSPSLNTPTHLVAKLDNLYLSDPIDTTIEVNVWYNDAQTSERQVIYSSSGVWRDTCQYDLYFGMFSCPTPNMQFYINVYSSDENGNVVLRTITNYCSAAAPNPPDSECLNGGVIYNNTCYCTSHFHGAKCEQITCENNGNALFGACQCTAGFTGQFCETAMCYSDNPFGPWSPNHRSLTLMVHDSLTTRSTLRTLNDVAPRVVNDILMQHPAWISNYQLIRFNDSDFTKTVDSESGTDFINGITNLYNANKNHSGYSCKELDLFSAIFQVISAGNVQWGGILYIFLYGTPKQDLVSYQKILQRIEINKIQINIVQSSLNPCGQDITIDGLISLTQFSGGSFITASAPNAGNVFGQVPTQYMSNLVYENNVVDCQDTTFYIPVDDGTQSFTAYIQGDFSYDPIYTAPDNSDVYVANMYTDLGTGSRLDHIVRACDQGWFNADNHCWKYGFKPVSWFDAKLACDKDGATLATIYNAVEQSALDSKSDKTDFWIGLNDLDTKGVWKWETSNANFTLSLDDTQYKNWQPGQPDVQDNKRCVMDSQKGSKGWATANCDEKKFFVCVKHTYSTDFQPSDVQQNHIARGIWKMRVRANGQCAVAIRSQSTVQVMTRFTSNIHDDIGNNEPNHNTDANRLMVQLNGVSNHRGVEYAHFYADNFTIVQAHSVSYRSNCLYEYLSTPFSCPNFAFQMLITGTDDAGYLFQRVVPAGCVGGIEKDSCENGGVYFKGSCICPPSFVGPTCEFAVCQNGGFIGASLDQCRCSAGFTGQFCEIPVCTRNLDQAPNVTTTGKTFIVAVDGTSNGDMAKVIADFNKTLSTVLSNTLTSDPQWFTHFVGIVFRDAEATRANPPLPATSDVIVSSDPKDFVTKLSTELASHPYTAGQKKRDIFTALVKTVTHPSVVPNSQAFVITAGNAEDTIDEGTVVSALSYSHTSVNFLFIGDSAPPGDGKNYDDTSVSTLFDTAHFSGGTAYQLPSAESLSYTWQTVLGTFHNSYYVITHQLSNCSNYVDYIQLDSNGTEIIVDIFSQSTTDIEIRDTNNSPQKAVPILQSKTNKVIAFAQTGDLPGLWTVDVDKNNENPGSCMLNIRGQSNVNVQIAFTQDTLTDGGYHDGGAVLYPKTLLNNAVVAQINSGTLTYVQLFDIAETKIAWAAPMTLRSSCSYQYISQKTFTCQRNTFVLSIEGLDYEGHPFRRTFIIHCDGIIPTAPPTLAPPTTLAVASTVSMVPTTPLPSCDPNTPKADIFIALDSSSTIPEDVFFHSVGALRSIENSVNLSADHTRVTIGTYDNSAHFEGDLNSIADQTSFTARLLELLSVGYTGINGNNIQSILDFVNASTATTPFRANPTRKIVLFVSSQGWDRGNFDGDNEQGYPNPTAAAKQLQNSGVEFFAIAYGNRADLLELSAIAKCIHKANDENGITNAISQFVSLLCSSTPTCDARRPGSRTSEIIQMRLKVAAGRNVRHAEAVCGVGWCNSDQLISASDDHQFLQWNANTSDAVPIIKMPETFFPTSLHMFPRSFAKNYSNDVFAVTTTDGQVHILSRNGKTEKTMDAHKGAALKAIWNSDGTGLLTCGEDGYVKMWSRNGMLRSVLAQFPSAVYSVAWDSTSSNVMYCNLDHCYIKSLKMQVAPLKWKAHEGIVLCCDWSPTSNFLVTGGEDCKFKVWDGFGQILFTSSTHDYPITALSWCPDGKNFAVGSHNILRLCDKAGWSHSLEKLNGGSVYSMSWSPDGTQLAAGTASGVVIQAHLVEKRVTYNKLDIVQTQKTLVEVRDVSSEVAKEKLETKEKITQISILFQHLIIVSTSQIYVYSSKNWNTPIMIDYKDRPVNLIVQCENLFLVSDGIIMSFFNYEGRLLTEMQPPGNGTMLIDSRRVDLSSDTVVMRDKGDPRIIHFADPSTGKSQGDGSITHENEIVELTINKCGPINDRMIAFKDQISSVFIALVKTFGITQRIAKIGSLVEQLVFNDVTNMLTGIADGRIVIWPVPNMAFLDKGLLQKSQLQKAVSSMGKFPQLMSFSGNVIILRRSDGSMIPLACTPFAGALINLATSSKWDQAISLCRLINEDFLWAMLAGLATINKNLFATEIAFAALEEEEKVKLIREVQNKGDKNIRQAVQIMLSGKPGDAENYLEKNGYQFRAMMLNIQMLRWNRALEIALKHRKFLEIVFGYREKYLQSMGKKETDKQFLKHMAEVEVDWIHIRELIAEASANSD
ncbi:unnamed protein product [Caenorhabditis auriculariae]|uniref:Uncharacterized protein n=1 Tax=Caenorhabditis auriculariae TaxID=2777116 RepID=A0A8S1H6Z9_9PELO|nr:unnamed protein product [Caenorhabditis auriculariae]